MSWSRPALDLGRVQVRPLAERTSLASVQEVLVDPASEPPACDAAVAGAIDKVAAGIRTARQRGASVMLIYGAHPVKNGAAGIVSQLLSQDWLTHLATNGAGTIHDWEFSWLGRSTESVRDGAVCGRFGTWDETGRMIQLALLVAGVAGEGYGRGLGRLIAEDGLTLPEPSSLEEALRRDPCHPLSAARAELLYALRKFALPAGHYEVPHPWKHASILASAFTHDVPITVHPGIGYDIIATHPMYSGAAVAGTGVVTRRVLNTVEEIAKERPQLCVLADSRRSLRGYPGVSLKMNRCELGVLLGADASADLEKTASAARELAQRHGRDVFVTLSQEGLLGASPDGEWAHFDRRKNTGAGKRYDPKHCEPELHHQFLSVDSLAVLQPRLAERFDVLDGNAIVQ